MTDLSAQEMVRRLVDLRLVDPGDAAAALDLIGNGNADAVIAYFERRQILTPFQIQKLRAGETSGYYCGRFKLQYQIAAGTFARVFRAIDSDNGQTVAVKILRNKHTDNPENIRQFHREGKLTEQLRHPNIAQTLEVGTDNVNGRHYIAMEFIEGGNLREFIRIRKKMEAKELARFAIQMVEGLRYAYQRGLTHRDIKPTNILMSATGSIKWVDFGLGGVVEKGNNNSQAAARTVDYAGLETATKAPKGDVRSDIFFLGVVFYELLTGDHPLGERDKNARVMRPRFDSIVSLRNREDVPTDFAEVIDKMLAYRPEARYQDYDSLLSDLTAMRLDANGQSAPPQADPASNTPLIPRVAIVHHSAKVQEILKNKLARRGFQTVLTTDIGRAGALCRFKPVDCIIIDLETTGQAGVESYLAMKRAGSAKSAVFLLEKEQTSWLESVDRETSVELLKPLMLGPVYKAVRFLVDRVRPQQPSAYPGQ